MKKAFKISAVVLALIVLVALSVVFTVSAADATPIDNSNYQGAMVKDGEYILTEDIVVADGTTEEKLIRVSGNVVLDLNGHTISSSTSSGLFYVYGPSANLTIIDSTTTDKEGASGAIIAPNADLIDQYWNGEVLIKGGFYVVNTLTTSPNASIIVTGSGEDKGIVDADGAYVGANDTWGTWFSVADEALTEATLSSNHCRVGYHAIGSYEKTVGTYTGEFLRVVPQDATITYKYYTKENGLGNAVSDVLLTYKGTNEIPVIYDVESEDILISELQVAKAGYSFVKWQLFDEGAVDSKYFDAPATFDCEANWIDFYNITLVATMTPKEYPIHYFADYGDVIFPESNPSSFTNASKDIYLAPAEKYKATFEGWYYDAEFKNPVPSAGGVHYIDCDDPYYVEIGELNLYAKFSLDTYKVTYQLNGGQEEYTMLPDGTVVTNPTQIDIETVFELNSAIRPGYTFEGWFNVETGEEVTAFGTGEGQTEPDAMTLEARFTVIEYTIIYDFGDVEDDKITNPEEFEDNIFYIDSPTFTLPTPVAAESEGVEFAGWVDVNGDPIEKIMQGTQPENGESITVKAVWKLAQFRITFNYGAGVPLDNIVNENLVGQTTNFLYVTKEDKVDLKPATRPNYDFAGWYYQDPAAYGTGENNPRVDGEGVDLEGVTHNINLYAMWTPKQFTITYEDFDGTLYGMGYVIDPTTGKLVIDEDDLAKDLVKIPQNGETDVPTFETEYYSYSYGDSFTLDIPVREGYDFRGWAIIKINGNEMELAWFATEGVIDAIAPTMSGDLVLMPIWSTELITFDVLYIFNQDWQDAHPEMPTILSDAATDNGFAIYSVEQYFGTTWVHEVDFKKYNGFVPEAWIVDESMNTNFKASLEAYPEADEILGVSEGKYYIIFFEPVVYSTEFVDGNLVVTYWDDTTKTIALGDLASIKVTDSSLIYVTSDGNENVVASIATTDRVTALEAEVKALNEVINTLKSNSGSSSTATDAVTDALKAEIAKQVNDILGSLPQDVSKNASDIADLVTRVSNLETLVNDLTARTEALEGKDTTLLIVIIIIGVIAAAAAVSVVVLFVKKK